MTRKTNLHAGVLAALALTGCGPPETVYVEVEPEAPARTAEEPDAAREAYARNAIWISLDTLRADRLGCYGYGRPTSPALDNLASEGVLFEDASAPSPWTMPSHGSMFTGLYPQDHGVMHFERAMFEDVTPIAELLTERGFQSFAVVSNSALRMQDLDRGFEQLEFVGRSHGPEPSEVTPRAIERFGELDRSRPFFALVHYNAVHAPYRSLPRHERKFVEPYEGDVTGRNAEFLAHATGKRRFTDADVRHLSNLYDAAIRQLDGQLHRLFQFLRSDGWLDDTLVIVTSDHGEEFFDHNEVNHAMSQYQELVRVPLMFVGPGLPAGLRVGAPASLVDLMPTTLAALGVPAPAGLAGRDLAGLWHDAEADLPRRRLYFQADCAPPQDDGVLEPGTKRAIRDERFKLHLDESTGAVRLFDLAADPTETSDVQGSHPEVVERLLGELRAFLSAAPSRAEAAPLSEDELARLRALGYVQGED